MKFNLTYNNIKFMSVVAKDENAAWEQVKKAGIRNKSNMLKLIKVEV